MTCSTTSSVWVRFLPPSHVRNALVTFTCDPDLHDASPRKSEVMEQNRTNLEVAALRWLAQALQWETTLDALRSRHSSPATVGDDPIQIEPALPAPVRISRRAA